MSEFLIRDEIFGKRLREIREKRNLTQEQVAQALRDRGHSTMCREKLSQAERGVRNIRINVLRDLKVIYGLEHYDDFFDSPSLGTDSFKNKKSKKIDNKTIWKQTE